MHYKYQLIAFYQLIRKLLFRPIVTGLHEGETFILDHLHIKDAQLIDCTIIYGGGSVKMEDSKIDAGSDGAIVVFGKAANTLKYMQIFDGQKIIFYTFPKSFRKLVDPTAPTE